MSTEIEAVIREQEDVRCQALVAGDYAALSGLMTDDLVHIHSNGAMEDKDAYIEGIKTKLEFLSVARPDLKVRVFGSIAVATGPLHQSVRVKANGATVEMKAMATLVWRNDGDKWRICSFQATVIA